MSCNGKCFVIIDILRARIILNRYNHEFTINLSVITYHGFSYIHYPVWDFGFLTFSPQLTLSESDVELVDEGGI